MSAISCIKCRFQKDNQSNIGVCCKTANVSVNNLRKNDKTKSEKGSCTDRLKALTVRVHIELHDSSNKTPHG